MILGLFSTAIFKSLILVVAVIMLDFVLGMLISIKKKDIRGGALAQISCYKFISVRRRSSGIGTTIGIFSPNGVFILCGGRPRNA